ncbi:hypothetical protein NCCP133_28790 [Cytobacillus sp. NCCP-133]|nr:hypothetical protein NCCP133_28790 [Cytobacillus sp. NCCP-133]
MIPMIPILPKAAAFGCAMIMFTKLFLLWGSSTRQACDLERCSLLAQHVDKLFNKLSTRSKFYNFQNNKKSV